MFRFIKLSCALTIAALALVQCTKDLEDISVGGLQSASATKIINTSHNATDGSLLVKFSEEATLAFEGASRSGGVTRSNIEKLNDVLLGINATSIERVFPVNMNSEAEARRAGLHRWYTVYFDEKQSLDEAAKLLAAVDEIEVVEFNTRHELPTPEPNFERIEVAPATRLATPVFNDALLYRQWDMINTGDKSVNKYAVAGYDINVSEAWKYTTGDPSVVVAVIDQGVDYTHEDLNANMWINNGEIPDNGIDDDNNGYVDDVHGYNFVDNGALSWNKYYPNTTGAKDHRYGDVGHGTHVAGTIAAVNNNGKGICGVAGGDGTRNSGVRIMALQIYSGLSTMGGTAEVIAKAFHYAADNGAVIANCSWGAMPSPGRENDGVYVASRSVQHAAIEYYRSKSNHPNISHNLIVAAAGNDAIQQSSYPAAYRDYISVTSFGVNGYPAYYTNYGPGCNIAAPGGDQQYGASAGILSTLTKGLYENEDNYEYYQGTSMACPHVAGVAALGLSYAKKIGKVLTRDEFKANLLLSVSDYDSFLENYMSGKYCKMMGAGRVDAFLFMMNIEGTTCIPVPRGESYRIDMTPYLADGKTEYKFVEMTISDADMKRLGMKSKPRYMSTTNVFLVNCEKTGSAVVEVKMIAGGEEAGTTENVGGMIISKKFVLVVRDNFAENGGWL
ncbi:MAG: S8 family serine peptidase [Alistipes sp.]|nr:S8 family serine peptidase [Alistipes sp.]